MVELGINPKKSGSRSMLLMIELLFFIMRSVFEAALLNIEAYLFLHKRMRMKEKERGAEVGKDKARDERNKNHKIKDKRQKKLQDRMYNMILFVN